MDQHQRSGPPLCCAPLRISQLPDEDKEQDKEDEEKSQKVMTRDISPDAEVLRGRNAPATGKFGVKKWCDVMSG